jgi:hypothetical protein
MANRTKPTKRDLVVREPRAGLGGEMVTRVTDAGVILARKLAAAGHSMGSIAEQLGMSRSALGRARERQPELDEAIIAGLAEEETVLLSKLREMAARGNVVPILFLLKTRHGYVEGAAPAAQVGVQIVLPDSMTPEAYAARVSARATVLPITAADDGTDR